MSFNPSFMALVIVLGLAFAFAISNGVLDGGSLLATIVGTRTLEPGPAALLVCALELIGAWSLGTAVAAVLGQGLIRPEAWVRISGVLPVIGCAVVAALVWNALMWHFGLPTSSSHALLGALASAMALGLGLRSVNWACLGGLFLILALAPLVGALASYLLTWFFSELGQSLSPRAGRVMRFLQLASLVCVGLAHGSNDGQKSMGIMWLALLASGHPLDRVPWEVIGICGFGIALGVLGGARRVTRTLGTKLYRMRALQGFCAQASAMSVVAASSLLGYPVSTTQVMSSAVIGTGVATRPKGIRWALAGEMVLAWLVTIPASAGLAAAAVAVLRQFQSW